MVFMPVLRRFLEGRLKGAMPKLVLSVYNGRIPKGNKLKRRVVNLLVDNPPADLVIALTDVYTGTVPPEFTDAKAAKTQMREWVGPEPRFSPHAAQHDFEAWLLPFWPRIKELAKHNQNSPAANPETVNHNKPPAYRLIELFEAGKCNHSYVKNRDAQAILRGQDLMVSINEWSELKAFVNTVLTACAGAQAAIP